MIVIENLIVDSFAAGTVLCIHPSVFILVFHTTYIPVIFRVMIVSPTLLCIGALLLLWAGFDFPHYKREEIFKGIMGLNIILSAHQFSLHEDGLPFGISCDIAFLLVFGSSRIVINHRSDSFVQTMTKSYRIIAGAIQTDMRKVNLWIQLQGVAYAFDG
ncbi:hypothetical protein AAK979_09030 [Ileibacterium valens]|uniref:hypothetical protein n=1 Tax=Ileibacterium valens TaxID=1862668 RepID=UPI0035177C8E